MATNNAVNISASGIVSYDGAGTFSALANPLTVSNGGSGVSSNTAYAVLCGGTTGTGAMQSIASVGTSGHVLTSNGAGALPTFQAASVGGAAVNIVTFSGNPADSTTYFLAMSQSITTSTASGNADTRMYIPVTGTITKCYGTATVSGTLGTTETSTVAIRLNNTTDTTVTSSLAMNTADNAFSNTGLSISVTAGDYIEYKVTTPAWATNPTAVRFAITIYVT